MAEGQNLDMTERDGLCASVVATVGRRQFLGGLGAAAALGLLPQAAQARALPKRDVGPAAWRALRERLSGPVLRPGDRGYARLSQPNNLRYAAIRPAGIARCRSVEDVRAAILWARDTGVPFVARSGGHSYAGFSSTAGLVVDLSLMHEVTVDRSSGIATLAGGARNGHVYAALREVHAAVTHGRCLGVGAAAFLLGGGVGFNMRMHGFGYDHMLEAQMVTASGDIVTASARDNQELFWASRGIGGGNLGIHTGFKLQGFAVDDLCLFKIEWKERIRELLPVLLETLAGAPARIGSKLTTTAVKPRSGEGARLGIALTGQYAGSRAELLDILAPAYRVAQPAAETVRVEPYWQVQAALSEDGSPGYYQERSRFLTQADTHALVPALLDRLARFPGLSMPAEAKFFQTGGAVAKVAPDATAFVHRRNDWLFSVEIGWTGTDHARAVRRALAWQSDCYAEAVQAASGGAYQNFVDPSLQAAQDAYYGANLPRLRAIKRRYDPDNLFRFAQSVMPG